MSISAQINLVFKAGDDTYEASLGIPTGAPTSDAPFKFKVQQTGSGTLLEVAVGDATKEEMYVAIAPPKKLIEDAAKVNGVAVIEQLDVVVQSGEYDASSGAFQATT